MGAGRGRRTGLILIVVIVLLLLVGVVAIFALNALVGGGGGGGGQQAGQPTPAPKPTTVKIVVAGHDIRRGTRLTEQDVTTMDWPLLPDVQLPPNAITVGTTPDQPGLEQVADRVARVDILQGQPVLSHMLTPPNQPAQLAAIGSDAALLIPSGMVAVAFPLNRMSSVAYALRPGDHVDVLMSFRFVDVDKDFQTKLPNAITTLTGAGTGGTTGTTIQDSKAFGLDTFGREEKGPFGTQLFVVPSELNQRPRQTTQLVIDNVIVMRVGDWPLTEEAVVVTAAPQQQAGAAPTPTPSGPSPTSAPAPLPDIITLIMSRQNALVLKYSLEVGADIDFALRSAYDNDVQNVKTDSVTLQYLMDTYGVAEPPRLPLSFDPSISIAINPNGTFLQGVTGQVTAAPPK